VQLEKAVNEIGARCLPYPEKGSTIGEITAWFNKDGLENNMAACDASIFDEVPEDISKLSARILKRWWSSYGLPYVTESFRIELEVKLSVFISQYSCVIVFYLCLCCGAGRKRWWMCALCC
jgi:hypothetical protein